MAVKILIEFTIEIMPIIPCIGVVFSLIGSLLLDRYHLFLDHFEQTANISVIDTSVTDTSLTNLVLQ